MGGRDGGPLQAGVWSALGRVQFTDIVLSICRRTYRTPQRYKCRLPYWWCFSKQHQLRWRHGTADSSLSGARRKLIPVCESYALSHGPLYNGKKSEVMIFKFGNIYPTVVPPSKRCGPQESHSFQVSWAHRHRQSKGRRRHGEGKTARCEPRLRTRPLRFARCSNTVKLHCSKHIALRFTQAACGAVIPKSHIML